MRRVIMIGALGCASLVVFGVATTPGFLATRDGWTGVAAVLAVLLG